MALFNLFDRLTLSYQGTDKKPDKQYSILPTVTRLVGDCLKKTVLDLGCGSGFFTFPIAEMGAQQVIGIDNSEAQLALAISKSLANTKFLFGDAFRDALPPADIVVAPFISNYASDVLELHSFFARIYQSLNPGGRAVFVVDLPELFSYFKHRQRVRFGAVKWWSGCPHSDGSLIQNRLYDAHERLVCILWANYYSQRTIQFVLQDAGFHNIVWHKPDISEEGFQKYGENFWEGYQEHPELGYVTVQK